MTTKPPSRDTTVVIVVDEPVAPSVKPDSAGEEKSEAGGKAEHQPSIQPHREEVTLDLGSKSLFDPSKQRFRLLGLLGEGGTSRVFAAYDEDLEREVAIKVVPVESAWVEQQFAREARVTSSLTHPNVPAVYDIGKVEEGYYLTLPRIVGRSLRAVIREARRSGATSAMKPNELVEVALKVCDALAYAHDRGIVHQDIKPENIMMGTYGEVMLVDWGAASRMGGTKESPVMGTPSYMAPEQAEGEPEHPRFDVYALGATLFHALLLRKPLSEQDKDVFWSRKLTGDIDQPTREEIARHPRALLAIIRRAMHLNPAERYESIRELAHDLRDFLAGGETWSAPIIHETFVDERWREQWVPSSAAAFETHAGSIVSTAAEGALLYYRERLTGGIALEYEATMLDGSLPGDISAIWTEDDVFSQGEPSFPRQGSRTYCFQVGALSNHLIGIFQDFHRSLSSRGQSVEPGRTYRIRVEMDERMLRLSLDGELVAEYEDRFPLQSGYLALYGYYPGKAFSNVRIYSRGVPDHMSPLAIGDAFFSRNDYVEAAREYLRVEVGQASAHLVEEAIYKRGICELKQGNTQRAFDIWARLEGGVWAARLDLHRAEVEFEAGNHERVITLLERIVAGDASMRRAVVQLWSDCMRQLVDYDERPLQRYLDFRRAMLPDAAETRSLAARALLTLGRYEEVLEHFASERLELCDALLALGKFDTLIAEHGDMTGLRDATLVRQGRFELISDSARSRPRVLLALGRYAEAFQLADYAETAIAAGAYEQALNATDAGPVDRVTALVRLGRLEEALATKHPLALLHVGEATSALASARTVEFRVRALHYLALSAFQQTDQNHFYGWCSRALALPQSAAWEDFWLDRFVLIPFAAEQFGQPHAFETSLRMLAAERKFFWSQRAYYLAQLILGEIDEAEFLSQPASGGVQGRLALGRALRAERAGELETALTGYRQFVALPLEERHVDSIYLNPSLDLFVGSRIEALAACSLATRGSV